MKHKRKLYLAGPEVFLPNAIEYADIQRKLCRNYDFVPLHPMDNNLDLDTNDIATAMRVYRADISQIEKCDVVIANCNPFRGVCIDDGTSYELGYGNALGKPSYGYVDTLISSTERVIRSYPCTMSRGGVYIDIDGYIIVNDFGTSINLMPQCGIAFRGGTLVEGDFEKCLKTLRADIDSGKLILS